MICTNAMWSSTSPAISFIRLLLNKTETHTENELRGRRQRKHVRSSSYFRGRRDFGIGRCSRGRANVPIEFHRRERGWNAPPAVPSAASRVDKFRGERSRGDRSERRARTATVAGRGRNRTLLSSGTIFPTPPCYSRSGLGAAVEPSGMFNSKCARCVSRCWSKYENECTR